MLAQAARNRGMTFDAFWEEAVRPGKTIYTWGKPSAPRREIPGGVVIWPQDSDVRQDLRAATLGARAGWKRAYEGLAPTRAEKALAAIGPELARAL